MKKNWGNLLFERVLFVIIGLLLIFVCTTGYWVYDSLSQVSESPLPTNLKENRRFIVRDLNSNILKSDNLTYSYLYQNNVDAPLDFEILESQTNRKIELLKSYKSDDSTYQKQIRVLSTLVKDRFSNLDTLMSIKNENRVDETMSIVQNEVQNASEIAKIKMEIRDQVNELQTPQAQPQSEEAKKKWFQRKNKKPAPTTTVVQPQVKIKASDIAAASTNEIAKKIQSVKNVAVSKESSLNLYKLNLQQQNSQLSKQIGQIFQAIELADKRELLKETQHAKDIASETNQIIFLFSVISSLLILMIVLLIITLFNKSKETNAQLKLAKDKSDQLTEAKSRFLATMSHEIRTPLNAISGFTEQLFFEPLNQSAAKKVKIIRNSVRHLSQITNEILDLSKLEKDHIQLEKIPFNPASEVMTLLEQHELQVRERNNQLVVELDQKPFPNVLGDPLRFRQIIINLISNANKFSKDGLITIHLRFEELEKRQIRCLIEVQDQGIGMSASQKERIFEPFEQADLTVTRKYGGTGLGLSITKQIIDKQGGTIRVNSEEGIGTTFYIEIPFEKTEDKVDAPREPSRTDFSFLKDKSILIVDDEPFNRTLLRSLFHGVNITLLEAINGLEALEQLKNNDIDIVLLDIRMPEMNGHELREKMTEMETLNQIPVVGLTATSNPEKRQRMMDSGWTEVLTKPVNPEDLRRVLFQIYKDHNMGTELDEADFKSLQKLTNNNEPFYKELLQTFVNSTENGLTKMKELTKEEKWSDASELAHQLAAPFKHFGANNCYTTLKEIERMGKESTVDPSIHELMEAFEEQAKHIITQVKEKLN
ncbi:MAG: multi-sensor hybrid histidine kinase [Fluviicola sp.]|jgi:signal transduction histidine kinase/DNA-binding response OmpR family regulator|uniref:ATP-binding response regulator n=1 Tax=Fluviicola sp. TaxID=1917219 RepID=UPI00260E9BBA|nr:ATP-binding protein [Fluviicola sp.]MDF3028346.1 multi-sensor hybrid histidine kinase [Fluviicola sp.]